MTSDSDMISKPSCGLLFRHQAIYLPTDKMAHLSPPPSPLAASPLQPFAFPTNTGSGLTPEMASEMMLQRAAALNSALGQKWNNNRGLTNLLYNPLLYPGMFWPPFLLPNQMQSLSAKSTVDDSLNYTLTPEKEDLPEEDENMPLNLSTKPTPVTDLEDSAIDLGRRVSGGMIWSPASMCEKDIVNKNSLKRQHHVVVSDECSMSENSEEDYLDDSRSQLIKRFKLDQVMGHGQKQKPRGRISSDSAIVSPNYADAHNRNCGSENSRDSVLYKFKSEIINRINRNSRSADEDEDVDEQKESVRRAFAAAAAAAACVVSSHQQQQQVTGNGIVPKFHGFDRVNFKKMLMENFTQLDQSCDTKSEDNNCSSESSSSPRDHHHHHIHHIANSPKDYLYFPSAGRFNKSADTESVVGPDSTANHHSPSSLIDFHNRFTYNENSSTEHNVPNHHNHSGEEKKRERNFQVSTRNF